MTLKALRSRFARALLLAAVAAYLAGCQGEGGSGPPTVDAVNATGRDAQIWLVTDTGQRFKSVLIPAGTAASVVSGGLVMPAGPAFETGYGCAPGYLVAYDVQGHEVARHGPSICAGLQWLIPRPGQRASTAP